MRKTKFKKFAFAALLLATVLIVIAASPAQTTGILPNGIAPRGVPASVTSFGFGGHPGFHGVPASVTSLGFGGSRGFRGVPASVTSRGFGSAPQHFHNGGFGFGHRHHHHFPGFSPYYGGYYYPYAYYPSYIDTGDDAYADDEYQGGPTIFDRRGPGTREYDDHQILDQDYRAELKSQPETQQAPGPVADQPETVLIFKDGHQLEISNYAIVGATLYDISDGRTRKVQLADLDLTATVKENDQRGVEFQLPAGVKSN